MQTFALSFGFLKFGVHGSVRSSVLLGVCMWTTSPNRLVVHANMQLNGLYAWVLWTPICKNAKRVVELEMSVIIFTFTKSSKDEEILPDIGACRR